MYIWRPKESGFMLQNRRYSPSCQKIFSGTKLVTRQCVVHVIEDINKLNRKKSPLIDTGIFVWQPLENYLLSSWHYPLYSASRYLLGSASDSWSVDTCQSWVRAPSKAPVVSFSKKLYSNCLVLVGSRNGFERDLHKQKIACFTIELN